MANNTRRNLLMDFYTMCKDAGYLNMADEGMAAKAKVIASGLGLETYDLPALFKEASETAAEEILKEENEKIESEKIADGQPKDTSEEVNAQQDDSENIQNPAPETGSAEELIPSAIGAQVVAAAGKDIAPAKTDLSAETLQNADISESIASAQSAGSSDAAGQTPSALHTENSSTSPSSIAAENNSASASQPAKKGNGGKIALALILAGALAAGGGYYYTNNLNPDAKAYKAAEALMQDGSYEEALDAFTELGDYKEDSALADECQKYITYQKADALYEDGDLEGAYDMFAALGAWNDAAERASEIDDMLWEAAEEESRKYEDGLAALQEGNSELAVNKLRGVDSEEAEEYLTQAKALYVIQHWGDKSSREYAEDITGKKMSASEIIDKFSGEEWNFRDPQLYVHNYYESRGSIGTSLKFGPAEEGELSYASTTADGETIANVVWSANSDGTMSFAVDNTKMMLTFTSDIPETYKVYKLYPGAYMMIAEDDTAFFLISTESYIADYLEGALK